MSSGEVFRKVLGGEGSRQSFTNVAEGFQKLRTKELRNESNFVSSVLFSLLWMLYGHFFLACFIMLRQLFCVHTWTLQRDWWVSKDSKVVTWLENCYPSVAAKRAAVDEFLAGIADAWQKSLDHKAEKKQSWLDTLCTESILLTEGSGQCLDYIDVLGENLREILRNFLGRRTVLTRFSQGSREATKTKELLMVAVLCSNNLRKNWLLFAFSRIWSWGMMRCFSSWAKQKGLP